MKKVDDIFDFYQLDDVEFCVRWQVVKPMPALPGLNPSVKLCIWETIMMVPAHIEQDCNAYDASLSGAGIVSNDFELERLLEFAETYEPRREFVYWVRRGEYLLLDLLQKMLPITRKHFSMRCIWSKNSFDCNYFI